MNIDTVFWTEESERQKNLHATSHQEQKFSILKLIVAVNKKEGWKLFHIWKLVVSLMNKNEFLTFKRFPKKVVFHSSGVRKNSTPDNKYLTKNGISSKFKPSNDAAKTKSFFFRINWIPIYKKWPFKNCCRTKQTKLKIEEEKNRQAQLNFTVIQKCCLQSSHREHKMKL